MAMAQVGPYMRKICQPLSRVLILAQHDRVPGPETSYHVGITQNSDTHGPSKLFISNLNPSIPIYLWWSTLLTLSDLSFSVRPLSIIKPFSSIFHHFPILRSDLFFWGVWFDPIPRAGQLVRSEVMRTLQGDRRGPCKSGFHQPKNSRMSCRNIGSYNDLI